MMKILRQENLSKVWLQTINCGYSNVCGSGRRMEVRKFIVTADQE